jgi:hypothetical protein
VIHPLIESFQAFDTAMQKQLRTIFLFLVTADEIFFSLKAFLWEKIAIKLKKIFNNFGDKFL